MSNSTPEGKENPVVTLKAQAEKFDYSKLRADENNVKASSGEQMYLDLNRMRFVINEQEIDPSFISALKKGDENQNYRLFAKEIFKEMFVHTGAEIPNSSILEELITSCNQLGYEGNLSFYVDEPALSSHGLVPYVHEKTMNINCTNSSSAVVKSDMSVSVAKFNNPEEKICDLSSSIEFTLESQDGKDDVTYKDGKLSLTVPRELKNYKDGDKNLFDIIKEYFYKFCEKLGFKFETEIEHDLDKPPKVNSHLENMEPPIHSNEHGNTPGN